MATNETTSYLWLIAGLLALAFVIYGTLGAGLHALTKRSADTISNVRQRR